MDEVSDIKSLVCSLCTQFMLPPITSCKNAHHMCSNCRTLVRKCPICFRQILDTRNAALEALINRVLYPCWKTAYGCTVALPAGSVLEHKLNCHFREYTACPYGMIRGILCDWKGENSLLRDHLHTFHRIAIREVQNKFRIIAPTEGQRKCSYEVISIMDTLYFYIWEVTSKLIRLSVFYIGSASMAYRFKYSLAICKRSSIMHHIYEGKVLEVPENNTRFSEGNSVSFKMSTFRYLIRHYRSPFALKIRRYL
jgi:E3 ubiquitin-protein ligase SIAH1